MSGAKIIAALQEAERGDFSRVTIAGHVWVRDGVDKAAAWDAVISARADEREKCAKFVEQHQERITETSNGSERHLSPRMVGNQMGLAYVNGIRGMYAISRPTRGAL